MECRNISLFFKKHEAIPFIVYFWLRGKLGLFTLFCSYTRKAVKLPEVTFLCAVAVYWHVRGSVCVCVCLLTLWLWAGVCRTLTVPSYYTGQHWSHYREPCVSDYPDTDYRQTSNSCCLLAHLLLWYGQKLDIHQCESLHQPYLFPPLTVKPSPRLCCFLQTYPLYCAKNNKAAIVSRKCARLHPECCD